MCSGRSFTRQARIAITSFPASDFQTGAVEAAKATNIELVTLLSSNTSISTNGSTGVRCRSHGTSARPAGSSQIKLHPFRLTGKRVSPRLQRVFRFLQCVSLLLWPIAADFECPLSGRELGVNRTLLERPLTRS